MRNRGLKLLSALAPLALTCTGLFAQEREHQVYSFPVVVSVEKADILTDAHYEVPALIINLGIVEFAEAFSRPEDRVLSAFLQAVKEKKADQAAGFILNTKDFSIYDEQKFTESMNKTFFRKNACSDIFASIPLEKGIGYLFKTSEGDTTFSFALTVLPDDSGALKISIAPSDLLFQNLRDYLNTSHPLPSPIRRAKEGEMLSQEKLAERLLADQARMAEIKSTIDRLEASGLREGFTPASQIKINEHFAQLSPEQRENEAKNSIASLRGIVRTFDFSPTYICVLADGNLALYYKEGKSEMVIANLGRHGGFNDLIRALNKQASSTAAPPLPADAQRH